MATDNTEPRTKLIIGLSALSLVTLVGLRWGLIVYYQGMVGEAEQYRVRNYRSGLLMQLRETSQRELNQGPVPIERAMATLARGGRPQTIAPQTSNDQDPLRGWTQRPNAAFPEVPWPGARPIPGMLVPTGLNTAGGGAPMVVPAQVTAAPQAPAGGPQPAVAAPPGTIPGGAVEVPGSANLPRNAPGAGQVEQAAPGIVPIQPQVPAGQLAPVQGNIPAVPQPGRLPNTQAPHPGVVIPPGQGPAAHPAGGHQ